MLMKHYIIHTYIFVYVLFSVSMALILAHFSNFEKKSHTKYSTYSAMYMGNKENILKHMKDNEPLDSVKY